MRVSTGATAFYYERGHLLETYVLHELRAWQNRAATGGELAYWRTPSGSEVDFIWQRGGTAAGIEVKASDRWRPGAGNALAQLRETRRIRRAFGVYLGRAPLRDGPVDVLPLHVFLDRLSAGEVLG